MADEGMVTAAAPPYVSVFRPLYDTICAAAPHVTDAVRLAIEYEDEHDLALPALYVSTAITSGGYFRDATLPLESVIARNGAVAAQVMAALADYDAPHVSRTEVMLPTELGHVPKWADSDYLLFYFAWLSGLSVAGTAWLECRLSDPVLEPIRKVADRRSLRNIERWPQYQILTEVILTNLGLAEARPGGKRAEGARLMLQLVDVEESLGCRAETLYADVRGLDRLAPTFAADVSGALGEELARLRTLGAEVGIARKAIEVVPVRVR